MQTMKNYLRQLMASYYDSNTDDTNTLIIIMKLIQIINSEFTLVFNWFIACILYCSTHNILLLTLLTTSSTDQISPHIHQELQQVLPRVCILKFMQILSQAYRFLCMEKYFQGNMSEDECL